MGFFSWQCAKTKKPVMAEPAVLGSDWEFASDVVVLFSDGDRHTGRYDGYGRVGGLELVDQDPGHWRMVIQHYYAGETFDQLDRNRTDPGQGYFYSDLDLDRIFG
jgi:hypothetical protein